MLRLCHNLLQGDFLLSRGRGKPYNALRGQEVRKACHKELDIWLTKSC